MAEGWTGQFFDPIVGERYYIPEDAANYRGMLGWEGVCIDKKISMSHSWAVMKFDQDQNQEHWIRTSYLQGKSMLALPIGESEPVLDKFARVWD